MGGWAHRVCLGGSNTQAKPPTEAGKASSWFPVQKEKRVGRLVTSAALLPLLVSRWIASAADVDAAAAYALRVVDWTAPWLMQKASKRTSCTMWAIRTTRATNADCCVFRAFWAKRRRPRQGGMLGVTPGGVDALKRKHDAPCVRPRCCYCRRRGRRWRHCLADEVELRPQALSQAQPSDPPVYGRRPSGGRTGEGHCIG